MVRRLLPRSLLIALDADGVLLDYNRQYGAVWARHFGQSPVCTDPRAYHAARYWGVNAPAKGHPFWDRFDAEGWQDMPAMPGAIEACQGLAAAGHRLVCVTSMPPHRQAHRQANLEALGFPIEQVVATGPVEDKTANPKRAAIEALRPDWFVDDELRKLKDLFGVRCVLVDPDHSDSPNQGQPDSYLSMRVADLAEFANRLLAGPQEGPWLRPESVATR